MISISSAAGSFHDAKGAYRLFANSKISPEALLRSHIQRTLERAKASSESLLIVHDTTDLVYEKFDSIEGLSSLTTRPGMPKGLQGMMLHNSLMLTESGKPIGIVKQSYFTHEDFLRERGQSKRNIRGANKAYPIELKASWRWLEHLTDTQSSYSSLEKEVIHVADREGDIYEFLQLSQEVSAIYVVRARGERRVYLNKKSSRDTTTVSRSLANTDVMGHIIIDFKNESGKSERHKMSIKAQRLTLHPPQRTNESKVIGKLVPIQVDVVEARSVTDSAFYWRVFTNLDCESFDQAARVITIYKNRWTIESYHRVLKSGFRIEKARLGSRARLENFCALVSVLAWRVMWLYLSSRDGSVASTEILSDQEVKVIGLSKYCKSKNVKKMSAKEAVLVIAQLGGFLNRKSDGPPGMTAIWKGWKALYERIEFMEELTCG